MKSNNELACIHIAVELSKVKEWLEIIKDSTNIDELNLQLLKLYTEDPVTFQLLCVVESTRYLQSQMVSETNAIFGSISRIWECIDND